MSRHKSACVHQYDTARGALEPCCKQERRESFKTQKGCARSKQRGLKEADTARFKSPSLQLYMQVCVSRHGSIRNQLYRRCLLQLAVSISYAKLQPAVLTVFSWPRCATSSNAHRCPAHAPKNTSVRCHKHSVQTATPKIKARIQKVCIAAELDSCTKKSYRCLSTLAAGGKVPKRSKTHLRCALL